MDWKRWLTRDRTHCTLCKAEGKGWVRIVVPTAERNPISPRTSAAYWTHARALFRRHVAEFHPDRLTAMFGR